MLVIGNGCSPSTLDLEPRVGLESAVRLEPHGPDLGAFRDGEVEPAVVDGETVDAALALRKAPGRRQHGIEARGRDVQPLAVVFDRGLAALGARRHAVIELALIGAAVGDAQTMNEAGIEIGRIERAARRVERQAADARAAVLDAAGSPRRQRG